LHDLDRRDLTGTDQFGQSGCVEIDDVGVHRLPSRKGSAI
jgi:hypothetical protein